MIQVLADACVARRNAASWLHARLCVMSSYMRDYAQRVQVCADVVVKTLSLDAANNCLQREYITDITHSPHFGNAAFALLFHVFNGSI